MNKMWIILGVFLLFGALIIKEQTSDKASFAIGIGSWIGNLFGNVKDLSGHAVRDYQWLPEHNTTQLTSDMLKTYGARNASS